MIDAFLELANFFNTEFFKTDVFGFGTIESILKKLLFLAVAFIAAKIFIYFAKKAVKNHSKNWQNANEFTIQTLNKTITYLVYLITILIVLNQWGLEVTALIAALGIGGIAIAFAAQETVANIIGGFIILTDKPFFVGDRIALPEAIIPISESTDTRWGDVVSIGLRTTRIKTPDNLIVAVPNAELLKKEIFNYTTMDHKVRLKIDFGISYESDLDRAKKIMAEECLKLDDVLKHPEPTVLVLRFGQSAIDLRLRPWIKDAKKMDEITSEILQCIKKRFNAEGIEIPYPRNYVIFDKDKNLSK